jgi:hypothetical protein
MGSGHRNWPIRARDEEERNKSASGPMGRDLCGDERRPPFRGPTGGYGQSAWDVARPHVVGRQ